MCDSEAVVVTVVTTWTCGICGDMDSKSFQWPRRSRELALAKPSLPSDWSYCGGKTVCHKHRILIDPVKESEK